MYQHSGVSFEKFPNSLHNSAVHEKKKPHRCNVCNTFFGLYGNLKRHIRAVHEGKKPFNCSICNAAFTQNSKLKRHLFAVHEEKKYDCYFCKSESPQKSCLAKHITSVHEGKKPFKCPPCDKNFITSSDFEQHESKLHVTRAR